MEIKKLNVKQSVTDLCVVIETDTVWVKVFPEEMRDLLHWLVSCMVDKNFSSTITLGRKTFPSVIFAKSNSEEGKIHKMQVAYFPDPEPSDLPKWFIYAIIECLAEKLKDLTNPTSDNFINL